MDKKSFLNYISYEDKNFLSSVYDKLRLAEKINRPVFSNEFYTPNLWKGILKLKGEFEVNIYLNGIFEECERKMLGFSKELIDSFPVKLLKITNKSKFEKLEHKDYLGAMMSLGFIREKLGDVIVKDNCCYAAVSEEIASYIEYNLTSIGRCPCSVEIVDSASAEEIKTNSEELAVISTSLRLDCVVAAICNISRAKASELISGGKVLLDYEETFEKDKNVDYDATITIRKQGKFKVVEAIGSTQSGRIKLKVKKYI